MNASVHILITIVCDVDGYFLLRYILTIPDQNEVDPDVLSYPMEPEYKEQIAKMLPEHVRNQGDICEIEVGAINDVIVANA